VGKGDMKKSITHLFPGGMKNYRCLHLFFITWCTIFLPTFLYGAEVLFPTYGTGSRELIVFTDYFCPPCMKIEVEFLPAVRKALSTNNWKVTFVDIPGHRETSLFAKYFIYAVQKGKGYENALRAREVLFNLSRKGGVVTEKDLEVAFRKEGIKFAPVDPWPVYKEWNRLIEAHKISGTPMCVLVEGGGKKTVFDGSVEIRNRLLPLMNEGVGGKKEK